MKILVTGGAGFIGSAVVRLAISRGHTVVNLDSLTYAACTDNIACVEKNEKYFFEYADIRDRGKLEMLFAKHKPDSVIHLAAETHVDRSIDAPRVFIETNINGTFNLIDTANRYWNHEGQPETFRFLHVSTDEVFGSLETDGKFTESSPYDPRSPYSASKACADHLVRAWHRTYDLPVLISNCSNNYGPYHFPEKLIPVVILNAINENPIPIYGDGKNIRDWLYVVDHANALLAILEKGTNGRSYNIGGENELTNLELVEKICHILDQLHPRVSGRYEELITFVADRPGHDQRYAIDPSRIYNELSWRPSVTIEQGLNKTVTWYLENKDWWFPLLKRHQVDGRLGTKQLKNGDF